MLESVLLVEDDSLEVENIKKAFAHYNVPFKLQTAENGQQALDILLGQGPVKMNPLPQIILLDIRMPVMDGLSFLKKIRNIPDLKATSIYILTHSREEKNKIEGYKLQVAGYLLKPSDFPGLVRLIGTLINYWNLIQLKPIV